MPRVRCTCVASHRLHNRRMQDFAFEFDVVCDEVATVFYVVLPGGARPPTTVDVAAGTDGFGHEGLHSGAVPVLVPGNATVVRVNGTLEATTQYDVYLFVQVSCGHVAQC